MEINYDVHIIESVNTYIDFVKNMTSNTNIVNNKRIEFLKNNIKIFGSQDNNILKLYYEAILKRYKEYIKDTDFKYNFFYRGHYSKSYSLVPSVFRGSNWNNEHYYYHEMILRCPEHFQNSRHLDRLVKMQHYGCPTRLLDVTSNPLVALYFACKNFSVNLTDEKEDGEVTIFAVPQDEILFFDSDRALILSCLSKFNPSNKNKIYEETIKSLQDGRYLQKKGGGLYTNKTIEKLFHEITTEIPSFKRIIKPRDLLMSYFVQPNKTNDRIVKQDGAFILCGLSKDQEEAESKINALAYDRIIIKNKKAILNELESLGINKATLFPEIDMVAEYLKESVYQIK